MGKLRDWADSLSPYIRLEDGGSFVGQYIGFKIMPNRFDLNKNVAQYTFLKDGQEKVFENGSSRIAYEFDKIKEGVFVKITRTGEGQKTTYQIQQVSDASGKISKKQADEIDREMAG